MGELLVPRIEQPSRLIVQEFSEEGKHLQALTGGDTQTTEAVIQHAQRMGPQYLQWETVPQGLGAAIVGKTYVNGAQVPLTGFEGYFFRPQGVDAEEVIRAEAKIGRRFVDIARNYPGGFKVVLDPEVIGLGMKYNSLMQDLNREFGTVLAKFRGELITLCRGDLTAFQQDTKQKVETVPPMKFEVLDGKLIDEHTIPALPDPDMYNKTHIVLSNEDEKGLRLLTQVGRFGHPVTRSFWHLKSLQEFG